MKLRGRLVRWLSGDNLLGCAIGMSHVDRIRWGAPTTHIELGEVVARWLTSDGVRSQTGHQPRRGPDLETLPLLEVLARVNRRGYVTDGSQPGDEDLQFKPTVLRWEQRAFVEGWADAAMAARLRRLTARHGLLIRCRRAGRRWTSAEAIDATRVITPTTVEVTLAVGCTEAVPHVRNLRFPDVNDGMLKELLNGWNVTLVDPEWGPSDRLWRALDELADEIDAETDAVAGLPVPRRPTALPWTDEEWARLVEKGDQRGADQRCRQLLTNAGHLNDEQFAEINEGE